MSEDEKMYRVAADAQTAVAAQPIDWHAGIRGRSEKITLKILDGDIALRGLAAYAKALAPFTQLRHDLYGSDGSVPTPVSRARFHATQARAMAAQKPVSEVVKLQKLLKMFWRLAPAVAPVHWRWGPPARQAEKTLVEAGFGPDMSPAQKRAMAAGLAALARPREAPVASLIAAASRWGAGVANAARRPAFLRGGALVRAIGLASAGAPVPANAIPRWRGAVAGAGMGQVPRALPGSGLPSVAPRMAAAGAPYGVVPDRGETAEPPSWTRTVAPGPAAGRLAARTAGRDATPSAATAARDARQAEAARKQDVAEAVRAFLEKQARLPPSSIAGFDPLLTPAWAGMQIPGM